MNIQRIQDERTQTREEPANPERVDQIRPEARQPGDRGSLLTSHLSDPLDREVDGALPYGWFMERHPW